MLSDIFELRLEMNHTNADVLLYFVVKPWQYEFKQ